MPCSGLIFGKSRIPVLLTVALPVPRIVPTQSRHRWRLAECMDAQFPQWSLDMDKLPSGAYGTFMG